MPDQYGNVTAEESGNYINPAYATPEQIARLREISKQLMTPGQGTQLPGINKWQGLSNLANTLVGNMVGNNANHMQQQALGNYGNQYGAGVQQMNPPQVPQQAPPQAAAPPPNPMMNPNPMANVMPWGNNQGAAAPQGGQRQQFASLQPAILAQESGNNPNIRPSINGAIGPGQIMAATFAQHARPGENINNPKDNVAVSGRILDTYMQKYGDPARAAVAYFSGPGNVAPPGSPTPWIRDNRDGNGKSVSSYVSDIQRRMGNQQVAQADPRLLGAIESNPWASDASKQMFRGYVEPKAVADVYGRPGLASPQGGVRPLGVAPGFQAGVRAPVSVKGVTTEQIILPPGQQNGSPTMQVPGMEGSVTTGGSGLHPLQKVGQEFQNVEDVNKNAITQVQGTLERGMAAKPRMATLNALYNVSQHLDDSGFGPRLQQAFKDATGIMPNPNADKYELFSSLIKQLPQDIISEAVTTGRISPVLFKSAEERGPVFWQDKGTRNHIINSLGMPIDMHLRAAAIANKGGDPIEIQRKINSIEPYMTPFERSAPKSEHIDALRKNPHMAPHFDAKFYPHTAEEYGIR